MTKDDAHAPPVARLSSIAKPPRALAFMSDDELAAVIANMRSLIATVGQRYGTSPTDVDFITRIALADPEAAIRCLLATACTEGIH
jgi:hypothetical protein